MKSVEDEAHKVHSVLSTEYLNSLRVKNSSFIKENIHKAIVVNRTSILQQMIKKILFKNSKHSSKKNFSAVHQLKDGYEKAFTKEIESAKRCHGNLSFRLTYLEQLLLEDQINLRQFKQLKEIFIKQQLHHISELSKKTHLKKFRAKALRKPSSKTIDYHINPYQR